MIANYKPSWPRGRFSEKQTNKENHTKIKENTRKKLRKEKNLFFLKLRKKNANKNIKSQEIIIEIEGEKGQSK